jgi:Mitochondrial carrier protein
MHDHIKEIFSIMNKQFLIILSLMVESLFVAQDRSLTLTESIFVGGLAGAGEVILPGQMLSYATNCAIKKEKFIVSQSYRGFSVNALGEMPIFAIQKSVQVQGYKLLEQQKQQQLSGAEKVAISFIAGVVSAVIDTPSSAVQIYLQEVQHAKKSSIQVCKELGVKKSFRGFTAGALLKEGPFAVGYQILAPEGKKLAQQYYCDNFTATIIGGVAAGVFTGFVTHPGLVIRNTMQIDREKTIYTTTLQTGKKIIKEQGMQGFYKGFTQRGVRIAVAVPLYVAYTDLVEDLIKS